jgi:MFS family permease
MVGGSPDLEPSDAGAAAARIHAPGAEGVERAAQVHLGALSAYFVGLSMLWGTLTTIVLPQIVERLVPGAVKTTALSAVAALQALVAIVVQPISGAASDRLETPWGKRRPFMVGGVLAQCTFLVLLFMAGSYPAVIVAMMLQELASNTAQGPYQGLLPDLVPTDKRGLASGYLGASQLVGQVAGVAIAGVLAASGELHWAILFAGAAVLVGMLTTVLGVTERVEPALAEVRGRDWARGTFRLRGWAAPIRAMVLDVWGRDVLEKRDYLWLLASRLLILMATGTLQPFAYFYLEDSLGLGSSAGLAVTPLAATVAFVALASAIPGGALTSRWGRVRTVLVSAAFGAVGSLLFAVAPSYWMVFLFAIPFGVALGVFLSADWALLVEVAPPGESGRYLGLSNTVTAAASVLAVVIGGPLADLVNASEPGVGYRAIFVLAAVEFAAGALCVGRVHEPGPGAGGSGASGSGGSGAGASGASVLGASAASVSGAWGASGKQTLPGRSAPSPHLEFILRPIERLDSRLRGIRPVRPEGVLGIELRRHNGPDVLLADGTAIRRGDRIAELHLLNSRVMEIGVSGWQAEGARLARADMAALAEWWRDQPEDRRPLALHGETILAPFARFGGFETCDAANDWLHRLRVWYVRGLLARWSPQGRRRLARGRNPLRLRIIWLSGGELLRRFGPAAGARRMGRGVAREP